MIIRKVELENLAELQKIGFDSYAPHYAHLWKPNGFELFQAIDFAKKHLSENNRAEVKFKPLDLREKITLKQFEKIIAPTVQNIESLITDCLNAAAAEPFAIKRVILTGGTSQVPLINQAVIKIFGAEKILRPDYFSSVATGLGYAASRLNEKI